MKLSLFSAFALLGFAAAIPAPQGAEMTNSTVQPIQKRQENRPPVGQPAMSTVNGGVVPYDADNVVEQRRKRNEMKRAAAKVKKSANETA